MKVGLMKCGPRSESYSRRDGVPHSVLIWHCDVPVIYCTLICTDMYIQTTTSYLSTNQAGLGFNPICSLSLSFFTASLPARSASRPFRMEST